MGTALPLVTMWQWLWMEIIFECLIKYKIDTHDRTPCLHLIKNSFTFYLWLMTREENVLSMQVGHTVLNLRFLWAFDFANLFS